SSRQADKLFEASQFKAAKAKYLQEATGIVGLSFCLPETAGKGGGGVISPVYIGLDPWKHANMMGCCVGMAKCLLHENQTEMALAWLEEINALYRCTDFSAKYPLYGWMDFSINLPEMSLFRATGLCLASDIFVSLGNTGTGTARRHTASTTVKPLTPQVESIVNIELLVHLYQSRHPNPQTTLSSNVRVSALQVRGSWKKINIVKPGGVTEGRESCACFIWNSNVIFLCHFYVAGGRKSSLGPWYHDIWALDLSKREAWRQLPDYPLGMCQSGMFTGWNMLVHNNTAILFTGRPTVDVFDLVKETWTSFKTTYSARDGRDGVRT
ncbi:hypothetical protein B0H10DRAFT_1799137, partial [Mycena sp. CBHHK59/15]